ncbi:MAG TPA: GDSL-type esterase/lipase family protein, partial [Candidatus Manganitrophaceae bacterium]
MKVIAFGDSLTVGYQTPFEAIPYISFLIPWVGPEMTFTIAAVSGETTADMLGRFDRDVLKDAPDRVIVLGGANDIGWGRGTDEIMD